nr:SpaA isopeptide-forming pilin-related protein [Gracilibacillus halotolerans]
MGLHVTAIDTVEKNNIELDVTLSDEEGNLFDVEGNPDSPIHKDSGVQIIYDWQIAGETTEEESTYVKVLSSPLLIQEEQQGALFSNGGKEVGTFHVGVDGSVTLRFVAGEQARGQLSIEAAFDEEVVGDQSSVSIPFDLIEGIKVIPVYFLQEENVEANVKQEVNGETDEKIDSENVAKVSLEGEPKNLPQNEEVVQELEASSQKIITQAAEIEENLITKVELSQRFEDGESDSKLLEPGEPIELPRPYNQFKVDIKYSFALPNGHSYGAGSTYTIEVPEFFKVLPNPEEQELRRPDGTLFGTYIVTGNREIVITFNEEIEKNSDISGYIELWSEFNENYNGTAENVITFPISGEQTVEYPVKFVPNASAIDKKGVPADRAYNTTRIQWTVDINKNLQSIENAVLLDDLTVGDHSIIPESLKVYELTMNADGSIAEQSEELSGYEFEDDFSILFGDINSAYRIVYETEIHDTEGETYKNKAMLTGDDYGPVSSEPTVSVKRGSPLEKSAGDYDSKSQTITWEVKYNYDEKVIEAGRAKLTDTFGDNQLLVFDRLPKEGFIVEQVEINPETGNEISSTEVDNFDVIETENGFELSFNEQIEHAYKITYQTTADERVEEGATISNRIEDEFGNNKTSSQWINQGVFRKSFNNDMNYDKKSASWTMRLNSDEKTMDGVEILDTLPKGFTPRDVVVRHGNEDWTNGTEFTTTFSNNELTIEFHQEITKEVVITYHTDINFDETEPAANGSFTNHARLTWIVNGQNGSGTKVGTATFAPDTYTQNNGFKHGEYNLANKIITWSIGVNYNKATLGDIEVEDIILGNQAFDIESVQVHHMELTGSSDGYQRGDQLSLEDGEYEIEEITSDDGEAGFRVLIPDVTTPYLITYETDLNNKLIEDMYENTAIVKTEHADEIELTHTVEPTHGGEYTNKNASQDNANPRIVHWGININRTQSTVSNVTITDTPSENQTFLKDTFQLFATEVSPNSIEKGELLEEGEDYTLEFIEDEDGVETFILEFTDEQISRAYILNYDTYILYKGDSHVRNNATFNGDETEGIDTDTSMTQYVELAGVGGGIDGEVGSLQVLKVDAASQEPLAGAEFTLYDESGETALRTYTTGEDGIVTFKNLLYGNYLLKETGVPEGYVTGIENVMAVEVNDDPTEYTIENKKIIHAIELTKVDGSTGDPLEGVVFELQHRNEEGEYNTIEELTTNNQGKIYRDELEPGDYRFVEQEPLDGYQKGSEPITFTIDEKQTEIKQVTATNWKLGSVELTKFNQANHSEVLAGAEFDLLTEDGDIVRSGLETDEDGKLFVGNLHPGSYQFIEKVAPTYFELDDTPIPFEIEAGEAATQLVEVEATNELIRGEVLLTKVDGDDSTRLEGATFQLLDEAGEIIADNLVTNDTGEIHVTDLKPGNYSFVEISAPEHYQTNNQPVEFTIDRIATLEDIQPTPVRVENTLIPGSVELLKVDIDNGNAPLEGVVFELQNQEGDVLQSGLTTDEEGKIELELRPGNYQLVETEAAFGYDLNPTPIEFTIDKSQVETLTITAENELSTESVELIKVDIDNNNAPLEGVTFELQDQDGNVLQSDLTTDEEGKIVVSDLKPGNYQFVETEAAFGYDLDTTPILFTIEIGQVGTVIQQVGNELSTGSVELIKVDRDQQEIRLEGAVFDLLDEEGEILQAGLETDEDGRLVIGDLKPGNYYFVETQAPDFYQLDETRIPFAIEKGQETIHTVQAMNELIAGSVELLKMDIDNNHTPLSDAVFELQDGEGNVIQSELVTDEEGKINVSELKPGNYQFIEVVAPFGYDLDATPIPFTIERARTTSDVYTVEVEAENELSTGSVELVKVDIDNERAPLEGVTFELQDRSGNVLQAGLTTDADGRIVVSNLKPGNYQFVETEAAFGYDLDTTPVTFTIEKGQAEILTLSVENELSTGSVELIKVDVDNDNAPLESVTFELQDEDGNVLQAGLTTDEEGRIVVSDLKPGNYQFVETEAAFGYDLDPTPIEFTIEIGQVETVIKQVGNELSTGSVELRKVDRDQQDIPLEGAVFNLLDADGEVLQADLVTDENGRLVVDGLKPGSYYFVETQAPEYYQLDATPIAFTIEKGQEMIFTVRAMNELITGSVELVKVDSDNERAPLADVMFELQDGDGNVLQAGLTTDEEGRIVVSDLKPGNYQFVETEAAFGYDLDATPIGFAIERSKTEADMTTVVLEVENELSTGSVELIKVDVDNDNAPLEGVTFELQDLDGNVLQSDLITDEEGRIVVSDLKPGNYQFVETEAAFGYDLDTTPIEFTIEIGQVETVIKQVGNELSTGSVELRKVDRDQQDIPLEGAVFNLLDADGEILQADLVTDENGRLVVEGLKPGSYYFVETQAPEYYQLDATPIAFTIEKGQEMIFTVTAMNELIRGSVELVKVDSDNHELVLEGAEFELRDDEGNVVLTGLTTDRAGMLIVDDLKPGTYQFVETGAPEGYQLDDTPIFFEIVKGQADAIQLTAENQLLEETVEQEEPTEEQQETSSGHQPTQPVNASKQEDTGTLPNTATSIFNYLVAGIAILLVGIFLYRRKLN